MQHADQHDQAIKPTVRINNSVTCSIFDDKIKQLGDIKVEKGKITIQLDYGFSLINPDATKDYLIDSIRLGLEHCFDANRDAFDPHAL